MLAICGISRNDELFDVHVLWQNTGERGKYVLEVRQSFAKACAAHKTINSFFYHSTGGHDEENILNIELMLLWPKYKVSIYDCQLQISLGKCYLCAGINMTFITFVDLSIKCKIFILCFLMFLTYVMVSHNFHFPTFIFSCPVPSKTTE